jgi:predicted outer membrane protein
MRQLLLAAALILPALLTSPAPAQQTGDTAPSVGNLQALEPASFLAVAASLAMFEIEAGNQVLRSATRPELVELAHDTIRLQDEVMQRLRRAAQERGHSLPDAMSLEHRAVLEGLASLDGAELERRYAETQVQALDQALELYRSAAGQEGDAGLKSLAGEVLPRLERQDQAAQRAVQLVRP